MSLSNSPHSLILFETTRLFLRALSIAETHHLPHRVLAVPPRLSALCGMCIDVSGETLPIFVAALDTAAIPYTISQDKDKIQ